MLNNATGFDRIYIACGYTDLRQGIDGLSAVIRRQLGVDPFQKNVLFLFCGRKPDKIKCLIWEGDGFLLLYKRLLDSRYQAFRVIANQCAHWCGNPFPLFRMRHVERKNGRRGAHCASAGSPPIPLVRTRTANGRPYDRIFAAMTYVIPACP